MKLEACINDIHHWMPLNGLKLDNGKTEFLVLQSKNTPQLEAHNTHIGLDNIGASSTAHNLGVIIDSTLCLLTWQLSVKQQLFKSIVSVASVTS